MFEGIFAGCERGFARLASGGWRLLAPGTRAFGLPRNGRLDRRGRACHPLSGNGPACREYAARHLRRRRATEVPDDCGGRPWEFPSRAGEVLSAHGSGRRPALGGSAPTLPFHVAPAYDMLPMLWAPGLQGEIVNRTFSPAPPLPAAQAQWREAMEWAAVFWERVAANARLSADFLNFATEARATLRRLNA